MLTPLSPQRLARRFWLAGCIIVLLGIASAALVWLTVPPDAPGFDFDTKKYELQVAQISGRGGLLAVQLQQWFVSLWQGQRLGNTLLLLALALGLLCFAIARFLDTHRFDDDAADDATARRRE